MTDAELASHIADATGKMLFDLRASEVLEGTVLGDEGDRIANGFILKALHEQRPDDAILSEEELNDTARCSHSRVWIVDPLDGTREYREGRSDWAVHIGLAIDGVATVGAVALPGLGLTLSSDPPILQPSAGSKLRMVVSRTRPAREALHVADTLGAELIPMGSAGAKAMAIVRGEAEIYLHSGGQYEWDNCAPVAVAQAAGFHVSRIDGSPLRYNNPDPYLPDLLICRPELAERVLELIRGLEP